MSLTGTGDHNHRNGRSRSPEWVIRFAGISDHDAPENAVCLATPKLGLISKPGEPNLVPRFEDEANGACSGPPTTRSCADCHSCRLDCPTSKGTSLLALGDLREEPGAGKPHAGICGGEAEWLSYPTGTERRQVRPGSRFSWTRLYVGWASVRCPRCFRP